MPVAYFFFAVAFIAVSALTAVALIGLPILWLAAKIYYRRNP